MEQKGQTNKDYFGYKWITVGQFKFDPSKTYEENYKILLEHHIKETNFLLDEVRALAGQISEVEHINK